MLRTKLISDRDLAVSAGLGRRGAKMAYMSTDELQVDG